MLSRGTQLALGVGFLLALVGAALLAAKLTVDHLIYRDAVASGQRWAQFLAANFDDLGRTETGRGPLADGLLPLDQAREIGQVFRYRIFSPEGEVLRADDGRRAEGSPTQNAEQGRKEHSDIAARVAAEGRSIAIPKEGQPPLHPPFFSEVYVPVTKDGRTVAVVEAAVNQTEQRERYRTLFGYAALSIGLFCALAFGLPALAWYRRTQQKVRADAQIRFLGRHDLMTQLPNWKYLLETLQMALATLPASGTALAIHSIELDRLKDVSNTLGHEAGNEVMRKAAERLRAIAGPNDMAASLGGGNLGFMQAHATSIEAIENIAQRIVNELGKPYSTTGKDVTISASIGVAIAPAHGKDPARLMKSAALALEQAKEAGRNCVRFFTPDMATAVDQRMEVENAIREAIARERFELHFQPVFQLRTNRLVGFEALLRLPKGNGQFVPPAVFIPIAEQMRLINSLGHWTMRRACRIATMWPEHLKLSVNLSPAQFLGGEVAEMVKQALRESGLEPQRLELEVTENLLLSDSDVVLAELDQLKKIGVGIVMDDFGTGYSSLHYLWRFPFDAIKIDASFVSGLEGGDPNVQKIISTIVALGRSLDMTVTAEGVETVWQAEFLREIGCDQVQGFLFARPMPEPDIAGAILDDYWRSLPVELVREAAERNRDGAAA